MGAAPSEIDRQLQRLESELRRLEAEYNMFFSGRLPRPPWETRSRVEALVKQYDRAVIQNYGDRFRFTTLQSRFAAFVDLWDRGLRTRDEGSPMSFGRGRPAVVKEPPKKGPEERVLHVASFEDPVRETGKLTELYETLADARRELGEDTLPFHKFADVVRTQVEKMRQGGSAAVAFRVAIKDGKVNFTARTSRGANEKGGTE